MMKKLNEKTPLFSNQIVIVTFDALVDTVSFTNALPIRIYNQTQIKK